jgi:hypothetical protein
MKNPPPPEWMKAGAYADYHSVIGREITKPHLLITGDPFQSASGTWVVFVRAVSGYVACAALTWPASEPAPVVERAGGSDASA